jgi:hypothetical protein
VVVDELLQRPLQMPSGDRIGGPPRRALHTANTNRRVPSVEGA